MKSILRASLLPAVLLGSAVAAAPATAQVSPDFANSKIVVVEQEAGDHGYWTTTFDTFDPDNKRKAIAEERKQIRQQMMERRVLEEYAEFLSPLRLPHTLKLFASDCGGNQWDSPYYTSTIHAINMCYSFFAAANKDADYLLDLQARGKLWTPVSREQYVAGLFTSVLMHETGHALFDQLDIPVFGREEDGADEVAAFLALQFGKETARTIIKGFAYMWAISGDPRTQAMDITDPKYPTDPDQQCWVDPFCAFSDEHGTSSQRLYNTLCIAYGGDPATFQDFVDSGWLPPERAKNCAKEYQQIKFAFEKTILPFIDQEQMAKVRERQWFQPAELQEK